MGIKVYKGTPQDSEFLCRTCRFSTIASDDRGREMIRCSAFDSRITSKIVRCQEYFHRRLPYKYDLEELAWTLRSDGHKEPFGFQPPARRDRTL